MKKLAAFPQPVPLRRFEKFRPLFTGDVFELSYGRDFKTAPPNYRTTLYTAARALGYVVRISSKGIDKLVVQATKRQKPYWQTMNMGR